MPDDAEQPPSPVVADGAARSSTDGVAGAAGAAPDTGRRPPAAVHTMQRLTAFEQRLTAFEQRVVADAKGARQFEQERLPAWLRKTEGEHRWQMGLAIVAAIALQILLPRQLTVSPHFALPIVEGLIAIGLLIANPGRIVRHSAGLHAAALALLGLISASNVISAGLLVRQIVDGTDASGSRLLLQGVDIWLTNVIVFGLWYWEFDRGGPVQRAHGIRAHADLLFPQMQQPDVAPADWEPTFFDYLYTSFTNATAFSPTDTLPLSRWAKALFLLQSAISLVTVALVISRAVNIFRDSSAS
ncbi:MAG: hypothetical protein ACRDV3_04305 [Acidothermaceae bacterium]